LKVARRAIVTIDSNVSVLNYIRTLLSREGCSVVGFVSASAALDHLRSKGGSHLVFVASDLEGEDYREVIRDIHRINSRLIIVAMQYLFPHHEVADVIRAGAREVLFKPFLPRDLLDIVSRLAPREAPEAEADGVEVQIEDGMSLVYASPVMREIEQQATLVARANLPVLILGESGTGKEIFARYIHKLSPRARATFLKVNCAAVPSELLESELFGYEAGAFTGAGRSKPGKFKLCHRGTMFLDEIGEMHPALQAKLLQVLQDGSFSPLGSRTTERVDVSIIAATNIDMKLAIANRMFREDLYYRLNGFCIKLPPLRERREDIPVLIRYLVARHARAMGGGDFVPVISDRLVKACMRYDWPGNARELESFVKRFLVLGDEREMLNELAVEAADADCQSQILTPSLILQVLQTSGGNRRVAAQKLGLSYKVFLQRLRQFGMEVKPNSMEVTQGIS